MWKGKRVCFLGDSITEGVGVMPGERYFDILSSKFEFNAYGYGVNGAKFINLMKQAETMHNDFGSDVDVIFVFAGTNNFNGGTPLGSWYDETEENVVSMKNEDGTPAEYQKRRKRSFNLDNETFKGCINTVMSYLKHNYATKQIIMMTPIHRAFAQFSNDNIQYNELYSNKIGLFIDEYVQALREASQIWSAELIDLNRIGGFFPLYDEGKMYFVNKDTDCLHLNAAGHNRLADIIGSKLSNIYL